jgi:two-component system sensor histidine kinase LytS
MFGVIGALCRRFFPAQCSRRGFLVGVVAVSELIQAALLFLLARPLEAVIQLEKNHSFTKIIVSSFGMVLFFEAIHQLIRSKNYEETEQQSMALFIADKCLPYLRNGLADADSIRTAAEIICRNTPYERVLISDRSAIVATAGFSEEARELPDIARVCMNENRTVIRPLPDGGVFGERVAVASALVQGERPIGCIVLLESRSAPRRPRRICALCRRCPGCFPRCSSSAT